MKRAIRYLRFSKVGQSVGSIERQELFTDQWIQFNNVELVDTFIDRGKSARTFDRPDFIKLQEFILKHHKQVDYLLVDQLDRFSRNAGEAMSLVKNLQKKYNIQIVSVTEGIVFDYHTPGSFFRAGLQLLLAEEDNINRSIKIRGGIYTAKAKEGRFVFKIPPFGYSKQGERKEKRLVVNESEAKIVRFIYDSYLKNMPLYVIKSEAKKMGFTRRGNTNVERVLSSPVYAGLLLVKPYKDYPGGLFPAVHEPIVDRTTWQMVQSKMQKPIKTRTVIDDQIPLRGLLKCHCGHPLSGAASRGKSGNYFYYYKCRFPKHNNISALKAHEQFLGACGLMSLPERAMKQVRDGCEKALQKQSESNRSRIREKKEKLEQVQEMLLSVEEKWIRNEITKDTYQRWYSNYNEDILNLKASIERLGKDQNYAFSILRKNLDLLTDMRYVYTAADTMQKREFVAKVFDNNFFYSEGIYQTPALMEPQSHNLLKMKEKGYLFTKKREIFRENPCKQRGGDSYRTPYYLIRLSLAFSSARRPPEDLLVP